MPLDHASVLHYSTNDDKVRVLAASVLVVESHYCRVFGNQHHRAVVAVTADDIAELPSVVLEV